jgi:hypothetical protein
MQSGCRLALGVLLVCPESVTGAVDEDVFQSRLTHRDGFDLSRESLDHIGNEAVTVLPFHPNLSLKYLSI